jgi:HSP20 family protein
MENKQLTTRKSVSPLFNRLNNFGFFNRSLLEDFFDMNTTPFSSFSDRMTVSTNVKESDNIHQIQLSAPGYKKENFKIDINNNVMTVSNDFNDELSSDNGNYSHKEFYRSSFTKKFYLPDNLLIDDVSAKYEDGILYIDIPKSEKTKKSKTIEIK